MLKLKNGCARNIEDGREPGIAWGGSAAGGSIAPVLNVDLPRTTKAQVKQGRPIPLKRLQAGDLVFFKPPSYPRHVGIYLGGSEFVHASKNKGVTLSKIDPTYWGKYYWTARRILSVAELP
jgi:hypothetical protein